LTPVRKQNKLPLLYKECLNNYLITVSRFLFEKAMSIRSILKPIIAALIITALVVVCISAINGQPLASSGQYKTHNITSTDLDNVSHYWNKYWLGHSVDLYYEVTSITTAYANTHEYVFGVYDCNDMAIELWQWLKERGIVSLIAVGNLDKSNESFLECNHAWLMVYSGEGSAAAIDIVTTSVYPWEKVSQDPQLRQYWEGFLYEKPSDLLIDFQDRW